MSAFSLIKRLPAISQVCNHATQRKWWLDWCLLSCWSAAGLLSCCPAGLYQSAVLLSCWSAGLLVCWSAVLLSCWSVSVCCPVVLLSCLSVSICYPVVLTALICWSAVLLSCWVCSYRSALLLSYSPAGLLVCWSARILYYYYYIMYTVIQYNNNI